MGYFELGDSKMPSLNEWEQKLIKAAEEFAMRQISEKRIRELHEMDKRGKRTLPFVEIPYLKKKNIKLFSKYLSEASIQLRRTALLDEKSTGFTYDELREMYSDYKYDENSTQISKARISKFKLDEQKTYDHQFLAELAILCRVPFSWLTNREVFNDWEIDHFKQLKNSLYSTDEFRNFLNQMLETKKKLVKGVVLKPNKSPVLYLRVQVAPGGFLVELFNKNASSLELFTLQQVLDPFECLMGIMPTVVENQQIYIFIKTMKDESLFLPDELITNQIVGHLRLQN